MKSNKDTFIQIRVTGKQKAAIQRSARQAGMRMSRWILNKVLPDQANRFKTLLQALQKGRDKKYCLAELNDLLTGLMPPEFDQAVGEFPAGVRLDPADLNYVAAMVELAADRNRTDPPGWTRSVPPADAPVFGTDLQSVRLHLLTHSPLPFRKRNIFIDASLGDRL